MSVAVLGAVLGRVTSIEVSVRTTAPAVAGALDDLVRRQLPFATAVALTRVAVDSQAEARLRLRLYFPGPAKQGRSISPRIAQGIRVRAARKADWPDSFAELGVLDNFMALHVVGGVKRPESDATRIAVPTRLVRHEPTGAVTRGQKPRRLRRLKSVFVTAESGPASIVQRLRKGRGGPIANLGSRATWFSLVTSARIRRTWPLDQDVRDVTSATYAAHFERELTAAVRSARVRAGSFSSDDARAAYLVKRRELGRITPYRRAVVDPVARLVSRIGA